MSKAEHYNRELTEWKNSIDFYLDEIKILEERLEEVAWKNTKPSITVNVEHFQNQFILQQEALGILKHDIHAQQLKIEADIIPKNKLTDEEVIANQDLLRDRQQAAEKIFIELKHSFYRFLSRVL